MVLSGRVMEKEAGPDGSNIWLVQAGIGPTQTQSFHFVTRNLTIKQGDTVVWTSNFIHTVTFNPGASITRVRDSEGSGAGSSPAAP